MKNTVTKEQIENILLNSNVDVQTVGEKTTIVHCVLPNGFVIVESSSCVDPANYDEKLGADICLKRIENKVWELEGYVLQNSVYLGSQIGLEHGEEESYLNHEPKENYAEDGRNACESVPCEPSFRNEENLYQLFEFLRVLDKDCDHDLRELAKEKIKQKLSL